MAVFPLALRLDNLDCITHFFSGIEVGLYFPLLRERIRNNASTPMRHGFLGAIQAPCMSLINLTGVEKIASIFGKKLIGFKVIKPVICCHGLRHG